MVTDAQFGTEHILRPFEGFAARYSASPANTPIQLFEGPNPRDDLAGKPGYDDNLYRGLPLPLGARIVLWLPKLTYIESTGPTVERGYIYQFKWRLRNVDDHNQTDQPFNLGETEGVPDATIARKLMPVGDNTITFIETEPTTPLGRAIDNIRSEDVRVGADDLPAPLMPEAGVTGVLQQGVLNSVSFADARLGSFQLHDLQVLGNELLVRIYRDTGPTNWSFGDGEADEELGLKLLSKTLGVYVFPGTAP